MRTISQILVVGFSVMAVSCATPKKRKVDFSVLNLGTDRDRVIARLGKPELEAIEADGTKKDIMKVAQGTGVVANAAAGTTRWVTGVGTLGIATAALPPREPKWVEFSAHYNDKDQIDRVRALNDRAASVFKSQRLNSVE
ncbi:MAG: hypothetical protein R3F19_19680 [Verrucomicrobiales bacterium]|nr:hypothetical protein [Verrucomicrobiae bacterium]